MDMALEDIIKTKHEKPLVTRRFRGGQNGGRERNFSRGSRNRGAIYKPRGSSFRRSNPYQTIKRSLNSTRLDDADDSPWQHDMFEGDEGEQYEEEDIKAAPIITNNNSNDFPRSIETGTRVHIENLEYTVTEENLQEIFERIGYVKKAVVHYDKSGRSEGTAEVTFERKTDALTAVKRYDGVEIDGKPVRLTLLGSNLAPRPTRHDNSDDFPRFSVRRGRGRGGFSISAASFGSQRGSRFRGRGRGRRWD